LTYRSIIPLGFLALSGCMVGPNYHRPTTTTPPAFKEAAGWLPANPSDAAPKGDWWVDFNDPVLSALEPLVAVDNPTLLEDYDQYEEAVASVQEERGALFPTVGLNGSATRAGEGGNSGTTGISTGGGSSLSANNTGAALGSSGSGTTTSAGTNVATGSTITELSGAGPRNTGTFEGSVDWTPDIWGKIRRQVQSDVAAAQVSAATLANATLSDQALLATDYVDLRAADAAIALDQATVSADQESLRITQNQGFAGITAPSDVITAQTQLEGAQAALINAGEARAQYEHAIAVLIGRSPAAFALPPGTLMQAIPLSPVAVPSTLLQRRPDIAGAERTMAEENALIGVAIGAYFPDLSLSALGGYSADPIGGLFSVSNSLWSLGTTATATLFEGGIRSAAVESSKYAYDASLQAYRQTVLTAFQDVENDLSNLRILAQEAQVEASAVTDAQRGVTITLNEYQAGTVAYTTVATAQLTLYQDQANAITIQQNRLLSSIALYEDMGGGFNANRLPSAAKIQAKLPFAP
jgi:NodT family efflux transporter outer membrane factor (OMF) lipoprotein